MPRSWNALGTSALAISLAVAVAPPGSATPGGPAMPEPVPAAFTAGHGAVRAVDRYRLATGETFRVLTMADGTRVPRVSAGRPFLWSGGPDSLYVVPRTAPARLRTLDLSLFDTTALARATRHGRTPVVVRYRRWPRPAALAGLRPTSDAHRTGRSTVVHATLGRRFAGFDANDLRSISSIRLDAPHPDITARATPAPTPPSGSTSPTGTPPLPTAT